MEISDRLEQLMAKLGENAASFSEKLGVQRSSLSHLLSARNKPSVDFLEKLLAVYPSLSLTWLITGKGEMMPDEVPAPLKQDTTEMISGQTDKKLSGMDTVSKTNQRFDIQQSNSMKPIKVMLFYANGTFEVYQP